MDGTLVFVNGDPAASEKKIAPLIPVKATRINQGGLDT